MIGLIEQVGTFTPEMRRWPAAAQSFVDRSARCISRMQADGIADRNSDPVLMAEILGADGGPDLLLWFFLGKEFDSHACESLTTLGPRHRCHGVVASGRSRSA